jgi:hypothetical protein
MQENVALIKEINTLRKDLKKLKEGQKESQLKALEQAAKEYVSVRSLARSRCFLLLLLQSIFLHLISLLFFASQFFASFFSALPFPLPPICRDSWDEREALKILHMQKDQIGNLRRQIEEAQAKLLARRPGSRERLALSSSDQFSGGMQLSKY